MLRLVWGPSEDGCYWTQTVPAILLQSRLASIEYKHGDDIAITILPADKYNADEAFDIHVGV